MGSHKHRDPSTDSAPLKQQRYGQWATLISLVLTIIWPSETPAAEVVWDERIEVAAGDAFQGPWRMNRSEFHFVDDPGVAIGQDGSIGVIWADHARHDLFFQRFSPDGQRQLPAPVAVSRSPDVFSWLPRLVMSTVHPEHIYVLWQEIVFSGGSHGGEIFFARSVDGGRSFQPPVNLSASLAGDGKGRLSRKRWHNGSLDLIEGPGPVLHAAWTEYEGTLWTSRSLDGGKSFSAPVRVFDQKSSAPARGPSVAARGDEVYIVWAVGEDDSADIHLSVSENAGQSFGPAQIVAATVGHSDAPKIAADTSGMLHLVFAESASGRFGRYHIRYLRSNDRGLTFTGLQIFGNPSLEYFTSGSFPSLGLDGDRGVYVLWELFPHQRRPSGLGFTYSIDGGENYARPTVLPKVSTPRLGDNGSRQGLLMRKLAVEQKRRDRSREQHLSSR